jgi:hypothetical protein
MKKRVIVNRINMADTSLPLDDQIVNLCTTNYAAGYELTSTFTQGSDLVLIFKLL